MGFKEEYSKSIHAELSRRDPKSGLHNRFKNWSRFELQQFLEGRGFAVYDSEPMDDLREAVFLEVSQMEEDNA